MTHAPSMRPAPGSPHTLMARFLPRAFAVVGALAIATVPTASQDAELRNPIVVPVTTQAPPYSTQAIWFAFSAGDTVSEEYRLRYAGRACEVTESFLRRERLDICRALGLTPWLRVPSGTSDSSIAVRAAEFADSLSEHVWGEHRVLVVAVVGAASTARYVPIPASRTPTRSETKGVVLIGLPSDSTALSELLLIPAIPYVIGVPVSSLVTDTAGVPHLDPRERHRLRKDSLAVLPRPAKLEFDTQMHGCGSMNCYVAYPVYTAIVEDGSRKVRVYVESIPGEGVLVEQLAEGDSSHAGTEAQRRFIRRLFRPDAHRQSMPFLGAGERRVSSWIRVEWKGQVATVTVPTVP